MVEELILFIIRIFCILGVGIYYLLKAFILIALFLVAVELLNIFKNNKGEDNE